MFEYQVASTTTDADYIIAARARVKARIKQALALLATDVLLFGVPTLWPIAKLGCVVLAVYLAFSDGAPRAMVFAQRLWPAPTLVGRVRITQADAVCTITNVAVDTERNCLAISLRASMVTNTDDPIIVFRRDAESLADIKELERGLRNWRMTGNLDA